jgi:hypothetical protein
LSQAPKILLSLTLAVLACRATAATIAGRLGSPAGSAPAQTVYAWSLAVHHLYSVFRPAGSQQYALELPPGRYLVFAVPEEAGAPPVYGAYTGFARCARAGSAAGTDCDRHTLLEVELHGRRVDGIDLIDWSVADEAAGELDRLLGRPAGESWSEAELAAPKFSEYPATRDAGGTAAALELPEGPRGARDQVALRAALAAQAPNFAGDFVLLRIDCGADCEDVALLDLRSGRVHYPPLLNPLPASAPCAAQGALKFRADSRLLTISTSEGEEVATRYYLLTPEAFRRIATLTSARGERCAESAAR